LNKRDTSHRVYSESVIACIGVVAAGSIVGDMSEKILDNNRCLTRDIYRMIPYRNDQQAVQINDVSLRIFVSDNTRGDYIAELDNNNLPPQPLWTTPAFKCRPGLSCDAEVTSFSGYIGIEGQSPTPTYDRALHRRIRFLKLPSGTILPADLNVEIDDDTHVSMSVALPSPARELDNNKLIVDSMLSLPWTLTASYLFRARAEVWPIWFKDSGDDNVILSALASIQVYGEIDDFFAVWNLSDIACSVADSSLDLQLEVFKESKHVISNFLKYGAADLHDNTYVQALDKLQGVINKISLLNV